MPAAMAPDCEISARFPCRRHMRGKARIETDAGHHDAEAIRTDQPHAVFLRGPLRRIRQRTRAMAEPGTDDDRTRRAATACFIDQPGDRSRRRGDDDQFGHKSQFLDAADGSDAVDLGIARIDEAELAFELGFANIVQNGAADRAMARTGADQRDGTRRKQIFQAIGRHRSLVPGRSRPLVNPYGIPRNVFLARHDNPAQSRPDDKSALVFRICRSQLIVEADQSRHRHRMRHASGFASASKEQCHAGKYRDH